MSNDMKLVVIESPYAGDVERNMLYLDFCIRDCLARGESPYASHRMLTSALDDNIPKDRELGIDAGLAWRRRADDRLFYLDLDWSGGMLAARKLYQSEGLRFEWRKLPKAELKKFERQAWSAGLRWEEDNGYRWHCECDPFTLVCWHNGDRWVWEVFDTENDPDEPMENGESDLLATAQLATEACVVSLDWKLPGRVIRHE